VDYALAIGVANAWERIQALASRLRAELDEIPEVTLLDRGAILGATVTFTVAGSSAVDVQRRLASERINVSVMEAASAQLDFGERGLDQVVRSSVHYYNSDEEIDVLADAVRRAKTSQA
jgi:cysteine desulfurase/selenocysteine lyase